MLTAFHTKPLQSGLTLLLMLSAIAVLHGCVTPDRVARNRNDTTLPDPVSITGHMTGRSSGDSSAGAQVLGPNAPAPPRVILNATSGQLEITVFATDLDGGISKMQIITNDTVCNFRNGAWGGSNFPTNVRTTTVIPADSNDTFPVKAVALANIQTTGERGNWDKRVWKILGIATNSAGNEINIGPLFYTSVSDTVPDENRIDGCP